MKNQANIFKKESTILKRKFIIKIYIKRAMFICGILSLFVASIFYDFNGEEGMGIILFLYSIILSASAFI